MLDAVPKGTVEEELIGPGTAAAIREMRLRGKSKKAIARELGLDIKTVRKWASGEWKPQQRRARGEELTVYEEVIAKRFPEVGYNAEVLYRELQEAGYEGSPRSVRRYVEGQREAARPELGTMRFRDRAWRTGTGGLGNDRRLDRRAADQGAPVRDGARVQPADLRAGLRARAAGEPAGRASGSFQPLRRPDGDAAVRQPAHDRAVEGRDQRNGGGEPSFQRANGLLRSGSEAVPLLPSPDQGEGRERGQVRQAECAGRPALRQLRRTERLARAVGTDGGRPAHPRHDPRKTRRAVRT